MERLEEINAPVIREVRGRGLLIGVELKTKVGPYLKALQAEGVLALPAGLQVLRFLPPAVITKEQIDVVLRRPPKCWLSKRLYKAQLTALKGRHSSHQPSILRIHIKVQWANKREVHVDARQIGMVGRPFFGGSLPPLRRRQRHQSHHFARHITTS